MSVKRYLPIALVLLMMTQLSYGKESFPKVTKAVVDFQPIEMTTIAEFKTKDVKIQKQYSGEWSNLNPKINLDSLKLFSSASSGLTKYPSSNLFDGKPETAWVEGVKDSGIGEWVKVKLDAERNIPTSTPFSIETIGVVPGYAKSEKTWTENNRVKTLLVAIYSTEYCSPKENKWVYTRLHLKDQNKLQFFNLEPLRTINDAPMTKTVWFKIEEVYPGSKFNDTCISEIVITGGCSS